MPDKKYPDARSFMEFSEDDPRFQVRILSIRVDNLGKEKEDIEKELADERVARKALEDRIAVMERSFQRGAGALIILPIVGTVVGILFAYGKVIFAPWMKS
jgi:hypothetical protein